MLAFLQKMIFAVMLLGLASSLAAAEGKEFRLGVISDKPVGRIEEYSPLARYAADRLEKFGIRGGKVVVAKDVDQMVEKIRNHEVDVVLESAFPTLELKNRAGMIPKLLVWKKGRREYWSVIFVRKQSPIKQLSDLQGKTIVFEDPLSTSAYLLPIADLTRNGLPVLPIDAPGETGAVRFLFGGEETNQAFFVLQNRADAGAFSSDDWNELAAGVKGELRIIHETKPVPRFVASFHPDLPSELSQAVSALLVQMEDDPEGRRILSEAANTKKIEPLSNRDQRSLAYVQELMRAIGQ